jgi:hypothetical protein
VKSAVCAERYEINLAFSNPPIAVEDFIASSQEISSGYLFTKCTCALFRTGTFYFSDHAREGKTYPLWNEKKITALWKLLK